MAHQAEISGKNYEVLTIFMQNKANFRKSQVNVNLYNTTDYENKSDWTLGENKPNSKPIKANFQKAQMNINLTLTKDYRKNDTFAVQKNKPNSNPNLKRAKMNVTFYSTKDYENEPRLRAPGKQTQSKPIGEDQYKTEVRRQKAEGRVSASGRVFSPEES